MTIKIVTEQTHEVCTLCGGRGNESATFGDSTATFHTCRSCQGSGQKLTKTVTRREEVDLEAIAVAVRDRLAESEGRK